MIFEYDWWVFIKIFEDIWYTLLSHLLVDLETGCDCVYKEVPLDQLQQAPYIIKQWIMILIWLLWGLDPVNIIYHIYVDKDEIEALY